MDILKDIYQSILDGDQDTVVNLVQKALDEDVGVEDILGKGLILAMEEVGRRFEVSEIYVPEMLVAARAMQSGLNLIKPLLANTDIKTMGKIAAGTVKGDLHDIGKNLVSMMFEGAGFEVIDLGTNVEPAAFVKVVQEEGVDILALSALLTTTMVSMPETIQALEEAGVRDQVKVIIGGAPVTEEYASKIGADGYGDDANQAAKLAKRLVGQS